MADIFETAHCMIALGGDLNNTVPKRDVTAGEIAVLQVIHGNDAITEIEPSAVVKRSNRVELARLHSIYSNDMKKQVQQCPVSKLYPGAAARVFQRLDELQLATSQFKPGMAPAGIDEREQAELKAIAEGHMLADGTIDEDAVNGIDDLPADDEPADDADKAAAGALA